jgi:hypothetical protein
MWPYLHHAGKDANKQNSLQIATKSAWAQTLGQDMPNGTLANKPAFKVSGPENLLALHPLLVGY